MTDSAILRIEHIGAGESGKSTIIKQMMLLYAKGFSRADREKYRGIVFSNLVHAFNDIIDAMRRFTISFERNGCEKYVILLAEERELSRHESFPIDYKKAFEYLWADNGLQKAVARGNEYALHDNLDL
jgi:guanine nucleotide-binding protein subunit alpha